MSYTLSPPSHSIIFTMHVKKPWEIYSKKYYTSHVQKEVEAGTPIVDVSKKICDMFENKSPKIQEEICQLSEAQKEDAKNRKKSHKGSEESTNPESDNGNGNNNNDIVETDPIICRQ